MKKALFLAVCLFLYPSFSAVAKAPQKQKCALEQVVSFKTAVGVAGLDFDVTISNALQNLGDRALLDEKTGQAQRAYQARVESAANALPHACWLELVAAENHVSECQEAWNGPMARTAIEALKVTEQKYAQTGNHEALEGDVRAIFKAYLKPPLPHACWFAPVPIPAALEQSSCYQAWSDYIQCYQTNQKTLIKGGTLQICYRPLCNPPSPASAHNCDETSSQLVAHVFVLSNPLFGREDETVAFTNSYPTYFAEDGKATQCMRSWGASLLQTANMLANQFAGHPASNMFAGKMPPGLANLPGQVDQNLKSYGADERFMGEQLVWLSNVLPQALRGNLVPYRTTSTLVRENQRQWLPLLLQYCQIAPDLCRATIPQAGANLEQQIYTLARNSGL